MPAESDGAEGVSGRTESVPAAAVCATIGVGNALEGPLFVRREVVNVQMTR